MIALLLSIGLVGLFPVSAEPELSGYHLLNIPVTNGARFDYYEDNSYYFKLNGGGLNTLHVTNDPWNAPSGQVNHGSSTGTFWVSDTGGRGFNDDIIILAAVNGTPGQNFNLKVNSRGYTWPLTYNGALPAKETVSYGTGINGSFTSSNFMTNIAQIWKPSTSSNYPIYYGQNMGDISKTFKLMFIDLKVGNLGTNVNQTYNMTLTDRGATRIDYTVNDLGSAKLAFNAYAWCNWSNQQQGVSWTNANSGSGASGWDVNI
ncbi:MAG TPA: nitroreductase [Methanoregulaceae archaeon]|nr:nitroreductase [Methanoregulaceae archaeon]